MKVKKTTLKLKPDRKVSADHIQVLVGEINDLAKSWKSRLGLWAKPCGPSGGFTVGSDCSGYGSDLVALRLLGLQSRAKPVMLSESSEAKLKLHRAVSEICGWKDLSEKVCRVYTDVLTRDNTEAPRCELYTAGYPCPSYSRLGCQKGVRDARGLVTLGGLKYIACARPRVVVLEQVAALLQKKHGKIWAFMKKVLTLLNYEWSFQVLNTKSFGIPQSRPRLYVVAVARESCQKKLAMPEGRREQSDLHFFLDKHVVGTETLALPELEQKVGKTKLWRKGFVVDAGASPKFQHVIRNMAPCLTKTSLKSRRYYIPKLKRRLLGVEACRLQGLPQLVFQAMESEAKRQGLPCTSVEEAIGDAMSINVLMSVLHVGFEAAGLTDKGKSRDFWRHVPVGEIASRLSDKLFEKYS